MRSIEVRVDNLDSMAARDKVVAMGRTLAPGDELVVDLRNCGSIFPNGVVPLSVTLDELRFRNISVKVLAGEKVNRVGIWHPQNVSGFKRDRDSLTHHVWKYDNEHEAQLLTEYFMDAVQHSVVCEAGVIDALNWCLYEVLDNVFQHSGAKSGFAMMQFHRDGNKKTRYIALAVGDSGIGIPKTMATAGADSTFDPALRGDFVRHADLAIDWAVRPGITSRGLRNQGNGLHGLAGAVQANQGQLSIHSGRGTWEWKDDRIQESLHDSSRIFLDNEQGQGTVVDWRLDCSNPIDIGTVLGGRYRSGAFVEKYMSEEDYVRIESSDLKPYVGSRASGTPIRMRLTNLVRDGVQHVVVDLSGISTVSSSFADEVIAKSVLDLGEDRFRKFVHIEGANETVRKIVDRAIELRMSNAYDS